MSTDDKSINELYQQLAVEPIHLLDNTDEDEQYSGTASSSSADEEQYLTLQDPGTNNDPYFLSFGKEGAAVLVSDEREEEDAFFSQRSHNRSSKVIHIGEYFYSNLREITKSK
jgi:hypothetical protein